MEKCEELAALRKRVDNIEKFLISKVSAEFRLLERSEMLKSEEKKPTPFPASGEVRGDVPPPPPPPPPPPVREIKEGALPKEEDYKVDDHNLETERGKETDMRVSRDSGDEGKECSNL